MQTPLTLIPDDLGIHIRVKGLFDEDPSEEDIACATRSLGHDPSKISFVHRRQIKQEGVEFNLWRALWTIKK